MGSRFEVQRRARLVLLRRMHGDAGTQFVQQRSCRLARQCRTVALAAQVQLHHMTHSASRRAFEYRAQQANGLDIGQMPLIAQHPLDQARRSAAGVLHHRVVIELDGQEINVCQMVGQFIVPATEIGDVAERSALAEQVCRSFQPKAEGCAAIVPHRQRPAGQPRR